MNHDKTFEAISKLKDVESELHRLKNALERANKALDAEIDFGPQPDLRYGLDKNDWEDIVAAIIKVRDSRGIYLGCRPADVLKDEFLAMGLFKGKEMK